MVPVASAPSISTRPQLGSRRPATMLKIVHLPQPEGPIRLTKRPGEIVSVTGAKAKKAPCGVLKVMPTWSRRSFAGIHAFPAHGDHTAITVPGEGNLRAACARTA